MPTAIDKSTNLPRRELSWTGIFAGALVALSLSFLIHMFNLGIGLTALTTSPGGMLTLAIGGTLWLIICAIVTMFIAGWVAGRFARGFGGNPFLGALHGFLAWSLGLLIALSIASNFAGGFYGTDPNGHAQTITKQQSSEDLSKAITPSKTTEETAGTAGTVAIAGFLTFFFGALAAGVGGYYAVTGRRGQY